MRYKTYRGRTKTEALAKAKMELGNSFIFLKEEEKKYGLFGKNVEVEVTVGIYESYLNNRENINNEKYVDTPPLENTDENNVEHIVNETPDNENINIENHDYTDINHEKNTIENEKPIDNLNEKLVSPFEGIKKFLRYGDFSDTFIDKFIFEISNNKILREVETMEDIFKNSAVFELLKSELFKYLRRKLYVYDGLKVDKGIGRAISFVGPTGEGKTTTLAKLACRFIEEYESDLKIVTIDYYRIAAKEQLNIYAEILNQKFEYYDDIEEFRRNCDFNDKDVILLDTAGRGQKDTVEINELKKFLNVVYIDLVKCLVISATKKYYDMLEIIKTFDEEIGVDNIILTKLDETNTLGQALSVLAETGKPLTYVTDGQGVPEYIHKADIDSLLKINFTKMLERFNNSL